MSIGRVRNEIAKAVSDDNKVNVAEARQIVDASLDGKVTTGEARRISDLFEQATQPGAGSRPALTAAARKHLDKFFVDHGVPQGSGLAVVHDKIAADLATTALGDPLARPPRTKSLLQVRLEAGRTAHLNLSKRSFFVEERADDAVRWYGPISLKPATTASDHAALARRVLDEYGLNQVAVSIAGDEAARQSGLGGVGFEQALRASIESFLRDGAESGSLPSQIIETSDIPGGPPDVEAVVRDWVNRPTTTLGLVPPAPSDAEKARGMFPPENGETVDASWIFSLYVPELSGSLHWAITDRSAARPTYNYGFD